MAEERFVLTRAGYEELQRELRALQAQRNQEMTVRIDSRGTTYDIYFPTVGLHSSVRPREGDDPQSRSHFRAITGGLAVGRRLDWFTERAAWDPFQQVAQSL